MNNKGFMMAEVVVVASIILVAMAGLYASYNKIFSIYNQRVNYYDVSTLYELANYKKEEEIFNSDLFDEVEIYTGGGKRIFLIEKSKLENKRYNIGVEDSPKLQDYLSFLSTSINFDNNKYGYVYAYLVMEKCIGVDDCKYAYLEVFSDEITSE